MDNERYEHRIIAQKTVFLLKMKGIPLEYGFNLYVRGPYSPLLADHYYAHSDDMKHFNTTETLEATEKESVRQLLDLFGNKASLLEIGATYSYLITTCHLSAIDAFRTVKSMKSFYSTEQIVRGVNKAKQYLFVASVEDKRVMDSELQMWQRAGIKSLWSQHAPE